MINTEYFGAKLKKIRDEYRTGKEGIVHDVNLSSEGKQSSLEGLRRVTRAMLEALEESVESAAKDERGSLPPPPARPTVTFEQSELEKRAGEILRSKIMLQRDYKEVLTTLKSVVETGSMEERMGLIRMYHDLQEELLQKFGEPKREQVKKSNPWADDGVLNADNWVQDQEKVIAMSRIKGTFDQLNPQLLESVKSKAEREREAAIKAVEENIDQFKFHYQMMKRALQNDFADLNTPHLT